MLLGGIEPGEAELVDQDEGQSLPNLTRDNVIITDEAFFAGFNLDQLLAAQPNVRRDPRFLLPTRSRRRVRSAWACRSSSSVLAGEM